MISAFSALSSATRILFPFSSSAQVTSVFCIFSSSCSLIWATGCERTTVNLVPLPSSLSTEILPFIISTRDFTMERPSPVPMTPDSEDVFSLEKGSKICSRYSCFIPMPESPITVRNVAQPSFSGSISVMVITTFPYFGVYFTAFPNMFTNISFSFRGSPITFS